MNSLRAVRRELGSPAAQRIFGAVAYERLDASFGLEVAVSVETPESPSTGRLSIGETPHALVIEADPDLRELLGAHLRRLGCSVELAHNGQDGLRAAAERQPDVAVIDVQLSDIDGRLVFEALRRDDSTADCRIVLTSVFDAHELENYGDAILPMPFDRGVVDRVLAPVLAAIRPR